MINAKIPQAVCYPHMTLLSYKSTMYVLCYQVKGEIANRDHESLDLCEHETWLIWIYIKNIKTRHTIQYNSTQTNGQ